LRSQDTDNVLDVAFTGADLAKLRHLVADHCAAAGLPASRCDDFVLAAHEIAANAIMYAGGSGRLVLSQDRTGLTCRIADGGTPVPAPPREPEEPVWPTNADTGRGLWLAAQLADELTITSGPEGTIVTLHMHLD
jgi:anti-sigma regulatory factor (Ser/Thr protein kinase)